MPKDLSMLTRFTQTVVTVLKQIPEGSVLTYGRAAALAGNPRGARQVSRILHSMSRKYDLPWHRVVNSQGKISLKRSRGYELQQALLESEGIEFSIRGTIDLDRFLWSGPAEVGIEKSAEFNPYK